MSSTPAANPVWDALSRALDERGRAITSDAVLCRSVLNDLLGRDARASVNEVRAIVGAVESGAAAELALAASASAVNLDDLAGGVELRGVSRAHAIWALQTWMAALRVPAGPSASLPDTIGITPPPPARSGRGPERQRLLLYAVAGVAAVAIVAVAGRAIADWFDGGPTTTTTTGTTTTSSTTTTTTPRFTPQEVQLLSHVPDTPEWSCRSWDAPPYAQWEPVAAVDCTVGDAAGTTVHYVQLGSRDAFDLFREHELQGAGAGSCETTPTDTVWTRYSIQSVDTGWMRCGPEEGGATYIEWGREDLQITAVARNGAKDHAALWAFWNTAGPY
jgi:hypothetical protein